MHHEFAAVPTGAEFFDYGIGFFEAEPPQRGIQCLLNELLQRHLKATYCGARLCRFHAAWFGRHGATPVIELDFRGRVRNAFYDADAVLGMTDAHADMQGFNFHKGS